MLGDKVKNKLWGPVQAVMARSGLSRVNRNELSGSVSPRDGQQRGRSTGRGAPGEAAQAALSCWEGLLLELQLTEGLACAARKVCITGNIWAGLLPPDKPWSFSALLPASRVQDGKFQSQGFNRNFWSLGKVPHYLRAELNAKISELL